MAYGGDRKSESYQENQVVNHNLKSRTQSAYRRARLARDYPEIHARLAAGEFKSARAAARAARIRWPMSSRSTSSAGTSTKASEP